jgi:hypothetical protein
MGIPVAYHFIIDASLSLLNHRQLIAQKQTH